MSKLKLITIVILLVIAVVLGWRYWEKRSAATINSFDPCAAAGYPVQESYPEQCRTPDGKIFIKRPSGTACIQVITRARNPRTGDEMDFPTPCDVPLGWEILPPESVGQFCGGFAGIECPSGYVCQSEGNYPDAGGKCVKQNNK